MKKPSKGSELFRELKLVDMGQFSKYPIKLKDLILQEKIPKKLNQLIIEAKNRQSLGENVNESRSIKYRKGLNALFAGSERIMRTMAAEVLANELKLDLYKIDLSKVVSKYIGETEKNLKKVFDVAEKSGVILLFDEADALFGKRSEVKDAHDRYSNIEVSYLLQRMEEYDGLAILAVNKREGIDAAFLRRLRFVLDFPSPDETQENRFGNKLKDSREKR